MCVLTKVSSQLCWKLEQMLSTLVGHCNSYFRLLICIPKGQRQPISKRISLGYMEDYLSGIIFSQLTFISDFLPKMKRLDKVGCHCNCPPDLFLNTGSRTIGSNLCQFTNHSGWLPSRYIAEELTFN